MSRKNLIISQFIRGEERRKFKDIIKALALVIDLAEGYKIQHGYNVALSAVQMGKYLGLDVRKLRNLFYAGLLHDVGEVGFPKETDEYDRFEWQFHPYIQPHPVIGEAIVSHLPTLTEASKVIRWHHEAWDGKGYPDGLKGDNIPLEAQIVGLCDMCDVAYATYADEEVAGNRLASLVGHQFDPDLVFKFNQMMNENELWTPDNFDEQTWLSLGIDTVDLALLMEQQVDYYHLTLKTFANVIDAKHEYTKGHSLRVAALSRRIAEKMNFEEEQVAQIEAASFLHDAGKVGIPRCILDKPAPLSDIEYARIKSHPGMSDALIKTVKSLQDHAPIARHHHERFDGNGYPDKLKGDNIPIGSRVLAVSDTYDAMTSDRAYRKGLPYEVARDEIIRFSGVMYDPDVVDMFLQVSKEEIADLFGHIETSPYLFMP